MAEFTEPLFWSDSLVMEMRVEEAIRIIQKTSDSNMRDRLKHELHMHQVDYPCPVLRRALQQLNAMSGHKPFNKPPTQDDTPPDVLLNLIFNTEMMIQSDRQEKECIEISMNRLRDWIKTNFLSQCTNKYSWFALWCFLKDNQLLKDNKVSSFCKQMSDWFPNAPQKPEEGEVNRYREPYLGTTHYRLWNEKIFIDRRKGNKQSLKGFYHLYTICSNLSATLVIKRLGETKEQL